MITKNFRNELPMVKWIKEYTAIDSGEEIRGNYRDIKSRLEDKYWEEIQKATRNCNSMQEEDEVTNKFFSQFNITPVYEMGHFFKMSTDRESNSEYCYVIDFKGEVICKNYKDIWFSEYDPLEKF